MRLNSLRYASAQLRLDGRRASVGARWSGIAEKRVLVWWRVTQEESGVVTRPSRFAWRVFATSINPSARWNCRLNPQSHDGAKICSAAKHSVTAGKGNYQKTLSRVPKTLAELCPTFGSVGSA